MEDPQAQALGVDTFKFEPLSYSASKGFTVRIPGREPSAVRSDDESFRWDSENGYMLEDEHYYAEYNPNLRNTVTLNPLQYSQSTACAYDVNELSRSGNESAQASRRDWAQKSNDFYSNEVPSRVVKISSQNALHEQISRSESKIRSLQRLKRMSMEDKTARNDTVD